MGESKSGGKQVAKKPQDGGGKSWPPRTTPSSVPKGVPMLRYGQPNFHIFKEALSTECLTKYGNLGKLVELGSYYVARMPEADDFKDMGPQVVTNLLYLDAVKCWSKEHHDMKSKRPMMYGLIWSKLSPESMDEVKQEESYQTYNPDKDPEGLWKAIVATHGITSISKVPAVMKQAAWEAYAKCKQGGYESLITYRENFDALHKMYETQFSVVVPPEDVAMHFFAGLDAGRYTSMKTTVYNAMTMGSQKPPVSVNEVYTMAANWVKTQPVQRTGGAAMFVTTSVNSTTGKKGGKKKDEAVEKSEKLKKIECFGCHKMGHYKNNCPLKKENVAVEESGEEVTYRVNGAWQDVVFNTTREVSVHSALDPRIRIEADDVILDNGADISIFNVRLLREIEPCDDVKVHGIGGLSTVVDKTGYLEGFFRVHGNGTTNINVLSYAEVEDKYEITCLRGEGFLVHTEDRDIMFARVGKLYVAKWADITGIAKSYVTTQETEASHSKADIVKAKQAYELGSVSGYPSVEELINLVQDGNVSEMPEITR